MSKPAKAIPARKFSVLVVVTKVVLTFNITLEFVITETELSLNTIEHALIKEQKKIAKTDSHFAQASNRLINLLVKFSVISLVKQKNLILFHINEIDEDFQYIVRIANTDIDNLTPVEALNKLNEIKRMV